MNRWGAEQAGRAITLADRRRIRAELRRGSALPALRNRALFFTLWGSGLRISEALALDLRQMLEDPARKTLGRFRASVLLRADQAKGRRNVEPRQRWTSGGSVVIPAEARQALRQYAQAALARGWLTMDGPAFIAVHGSHARLHKRSAQLAWQKLQLRAEVPEPYRLHDLRHDAITRFSDQCAGDVFAISAFARFNDIRTAQRYVHRRPEEIADLAERAARG